MRSTLLKTPNLILQRIPKQIRLFSSSNSTLNVVDTSNSPALQQQHAPLRKYPKHHRRTAQDEEETNWDLEEMEEEDERHMSGYGWDIHRQQREFFILMRTLERDAEVLRANRRPFNPPSPTHTPVLVRSTVYAGEPGHPLTLKRTIVVPVSLLPLSKSTSTSTPTTYAAALHNLKVLAGSRWTVEPPKDSGLPSWRHRAVYAEEGEGVTTVNTGETGEMGKEGYIKISCELFPETQMNLKWCMDALRRLVKEANERSTSNPPTSFIDIPLPTRHHDSRLRSQGRGGGSFKAERRRVTFREDFPREWLPAWAREREGEARGS